MFCNREESTRMKLAGGWQRKKAIYGWERHHIAPFLTLIPLALPRPINAFLGCLEETLTNKDRYSVYNQHPGRRQSCLAHIDRSLAKIEQKEKGSMHIPWQNESKGVREDIRTVARIQIGKIF